jgi:hypothetical protein
MTSLDTKTMQEEVDVDQEAAESDSETTGTDEESESESDSDSDFEPKQPAKKKQKRTRDKKGKLHRTPEQNKKMAQNNMDKTRKAYAKQKDKSAYTVWFARSLSVWVLFATT